MHRKRNRSRQEQTGAVSASEEVTFAADGGEDASNITAAPRQPETREEIVTVTAFDGLTFEGKLRLPDAEVKDVEAIIRQLKEDSRLKNAKVILLGWSEGTMIAPLVALKKEVPVDALFLAGYCNETMADILEWQLTDGSSMVTVGAYLDSDGDGIITKEEYDGDPCQVAAQFGAFEELDVNGDGQISREDFRLMLQDTHDETFRAFDGGDDQWLKENYAVRLTSAWFQAHRKMAPNREIMPQLDLPIYIFQGTIDANVPVEQSREIAEAFRAAGKTNLHLKEFEMHDHDLNYITYPLYGTISEGLQAIFDTAKGL